MTTLRPEPLDELPADYGTPDDLLGDEGLFKQLKRNARSAPSRAITWARHRSPRLSGSRRT